MLLQCAVAGDYKRKYLHTKFLGGDKFWFVVDQEKIYVNSDTVDHLEIDGVNIKKSGTLGRAVVGGAVLGGVGAVAGAASAKSKISSQDVAIYFKDGKKALFQNLDKVWVDGLKRACF